MIGTTTILELFLTFLSAIVASSGFWMYIQRRNERKSLSNRLLLGLAHDRIIYLSLKYIEKGWISQDEYENLFEYLYNPYLEMNGNGSAKRLLNEINKLPIHKNVITLGRESKDNDIRQNV